MIFTRSDFVNVQWGRCLHRLVKCDYWTSYAVANLLRNRGPMIRQVRGLGTLVPEEFRWLPATTEASVENFDLAGNKSSVR